MGWGQLFGTEPHPRGTFADMANRYPAEISNEQNRDIGLGALVPLANLMRPTVNAAQTMYSWLPDSSTTQARKFQEGRAQRLASNETNPTIRNALFPSALPSLPQTLRPSNLPSTDAEFYQRLNQYPAIGDASYGNPFIPSVTASTGANATVPAQNPAATSAAPNRPALAAQTADAGRIANSVLAPLQQQGYTQMPGTDWMRRVNPAAGFGPGQIAGTTEYANPGVTQMGGQGRGYATFQGLPTPGGSLGYVGTPETANMTQAEATAYNVGNINRQIDALRSLREARNPGITQEGGYGSGSLPAPPQINPFERQGDSRLDTAVRQNNAEGALRQALDPRSGMSRSQRQMAIAGYQALVAPGLEQGQQQAGMYNAQLGYLGQQGQQQTTQRLGTLKALQEQQQQQQRYGLDQSRLQLDQAKYEMDRAKTEDEFKRNAGQYFLSRSKADQQIMLNQLAGELYKNQNNQDSPEFKRLKDLYTILRKGQEPGIDFTDLRQ